MREYEFSLTRIHPYKDRIWDSVLIRENTGQWKPVFSHILCSDIPILRKKSSKNRQSRKRFISAFAYFWSASAKNWFCRRELALGCVPKQFWGFANMSFLPIFPRLKSFGKFWGNSNIKFLILDTKFRFTCSKWKL